MQWRAVSTQRGATNVPPQKCLVRPLCTICSETIYGNSLLLAKTPPNMYFVGDADSEERLKLVYAKPSGNGLGTIRPSFTVDASVALLDLNSWDDRRGEDEIADEGGGDDDEEREEETADEGAERDDKESKEETADDGGGEDDEEREEETADEGG